MKFKSVALMVLAVLIWVPQAHAAIVGRGAPVPNNATQCGDLPKNGGAPAQWDWNVVAGDVGVNPCNKWVIVPKSGAANANGSIPLTFDLQHRVRVPGHGNLEIQPNPAVAKTVSAGAFAPGVSRAGTYVRDHPGLGHKDVYQWRVDIPAGGGALAPPTEIKAIAKHIAEPFPAGWSYDPAELGGPALITSVIASYPVDVDQKVKKGIPDKKIDKAIGPKPLPRGKKFKDKATDYTITVTLGDPFSTSMTLAYIVVDDFGGFSEADLATMNEFFVPGGEYFVPMLFDVNETQDLFIGVDLIQWLSFPTSFSIGDVYSVTNGVSDLLPGFFVATSPVAFDPVGGTFTSGDPLDGSAIAFGTVDGGNVPVPEPSTCLLFGTGLLGLLYADWRRRKRAA